jgi:hypothetical protein
LNNGLRRYPTQENSADFLEECLNMIPRAGGLEVHPQFTDPSSSVVSWPFPQIFKGSVHTLICFDNQVYQINTLSPYSATLLDVYDPTTGNISSITPGGAWHFADFGESWFLFNGSCYLYYFPSDTLRSPARVYVDSSQQILSGTPHRGRMVFGGLESSWWPSGWQTWMDTRVALLQADSSTGMTLPTTATLGTNYVLWSSIGGGDILNFFNFTVGRDGIFGSSGYDDTAPYFLDMWKRNDWGFMPLPMDGDVVGLKSLGDRFVVVYGTEGVFALTRVNDPHPTFGMQKLSDVGVVSRGAWAGDENGQVYIDKDGRMVLLRGDLSVDLLDHRDFTSSLITGTMVGSYDPLNREYHFSDGTETLIVSNTGGLCSSTRHPTSLVTEAGNLYGPYTQSQYSGSNDERVRVRSGKIDLETADTKTVYGLDIGARDTQFTQLTAKIRHRFDRAGTWYESSSATFGWDGHATVRASGVEFQIEIEGSDWANISTLNSVLVEWGRGKRAMVQLSSV